MIGLTNSFKSGKRSHALCCGGDRAGVKQVLSRGLGDCIRTSRHPELVSGSNWSPVREVESWMLKQVQHDQISNAIAGEDLVTSAARASRRR